MRRKQRVNWGATNYLLIILFVFVMFISIGYSSLSTTLNISGEAHIRVISDIRITNINWELSKNQGYETYAPEYYKDGIKIFSTLPNKEASVIYKVEVTNNSNIPYVLKEINNIMDSNDNMEISITIEKGDIIKSNETISFEIEVSYKSSVIELPENNNSVNEIEFIFDIADVNSPILAATENDQYITITASDDIELSEDNIYKYYLSSSSTELVNGEWTNYISGEAFKISGVGVMYLWVYPIKDKANNVNDNKIFNEPYVINQYTITATLYDQTEKLVYTNGECDLNKAYNYMGGCYLKANKSIDLKNHIWYNGFLWRIMGINGDGTVRLITEENVVIINYNASGNTNFNNSDADTWLNEYFYNRLSTENGIRDIIQINNDFPYFCQGAQTTSSSISNSTCTGTSLVKKVGLISLDEYNLAGGKESYLNNSQRFWTMNPYSGTSAFYINNSGSISNSLVHSQYYGIRPVINVNSNTDITSGSGTLSDHYVLIENKGNTNITGTLAMAKVGEYVNFNNKIYRIVENSAIIKLIAEDYYGSYAFGTNAEFSNSKGIGQTLNTTIINNLTQGNEQEKLKSAILTKSWYVNSFYDDSYQKALNEKGISTPIEAQVGLIRVGEILSAHSYSLLTNKGTTISSYQNAKNSFTITRGGTFSNIWTIGTAGNLTSSSVTSKRYVRPVINIAPYHLIVGGNGTLGHEYVVEILDTEPEIVGSRPKIEYSVAGGRYSCLGSLEITVNVTDEDNDLKEFIVNVYENGVKDETKSSGIVTDKTSYTVNLTKCNTPWYIETYALDNEGNKNAGSPLTSDGWYYQIYTMSNTGGSA